MELVRKEKGGQKTNYDLRIMPQVNSIAFSKNATKTLGLDLRNYVSIIICKKDTNKVLDLGNDLKVEYDNQLIIMPVQKDELLSLGNLADHFYKLSDKKTKYFTSVVLKSSLVEIFQLKPERLVRNDGVYVNQYPNIDYTYRPIEDFKIKVKSTVSLEAYLFEFNQITQSKPIKHKK